MAEEQSKEPLANLKAKWPYGPKLWNEIAALQGHKAFLVSFSRGKDSIALSIALRDAGYDLRPFYLETVPGLSFVEESLDYYERVLFKRHIVRVIHPTFCLQLAEATFQPPHWLATAEAMGGVALDYADVQRYVAEQEELPEETWTCVGTRASDSVMRRKHFAIKGPCTPSKRTFAAIWEWNIAMVAAALERSGIRLPVDYQFMGKSLDGLQGEFVGPMKRHFPSDYKKLLEFFPLLEAEVFRYEKAWGKE